MYERKIFKVKNLQKTKTNMYTINCLYIYIYIESSLSIAQTPKNSQKLGVLSTK